ncbi:MAG: cyclopropane-fatty-acyl-phospholipid synthase family protein [Beijerinckiaceae bacterium]
MSKILQKFLTKLIRLGDLEIQSASGAKFRVGDGTGPTSALRFTRSSAEWRLLRDPELAFGELYMDGGIEVVQGTIYDALMIASQNVAGPASKWVAALQGFRMRMRHRSQSNTKAKAHRNVAHHYDLDSRMYSLFLDEDMQYTCAYFEKPDDTLETAQLAKKRHIAAKLQIQPGQSVLDIGFGWGGLGLYLARYCGAHVTGATLSKEQLAIAQQRAKDSGLADRIDFRFQDYRDVPETFDRIVSVGMFEAVGLPYFDAFFQKIASALKDDGCALIHTIGNTNTPFPTNPWIDKYIFPGGYVPSMSEILPAIERAGLKVTDIEVLRLHYAETLRAWRTRFMARREEVLRLYDDRFIRMWEFYLALSEAGFRRGDIVIFQFQLAKRVDVLPICRTYMVEEENRLRALDGGTPQNA